MPSVWQKLPTCRRKMLPPYLPWVQQQNLRNVSNLLSDYTTSYGNSWYSYYCALNTTPLRAYRGKNCYEILHRASDFVGFCEHVNELSDYMQGDECLRCYYILMVNLVPLGLVILCEIWDSDDGNYCDCCFLGGVGRLPCIMLRYRGIHCFRLLGGRWRHKIHLECW